jgi:hypothetical protein
MVFFADFGRNPIPGDLEMGKKRASLRGPAAEKTIKIGQRMRSSLILT